MFKLVLSLILVILVILTTSLSLYIDMSTTVKCKTTVNRKIIIKKYYDNLKERFRIQIHTYIYTLVSISSFVRNFSWYSSHLEYFAFLFSSYIYIYIYEEKRKAKYSKQDEYQEKLTLTSNQQNPLFHLSISLQFF